MRKCYVSAAKLVLCIFLAVLSLPALAQLRQGPFPLPASAVKFNPATQACGTDLLLAEWRKKPGFKAKEDAMNRQIRGMLGTSAATYILPVVFHIINPNPAGITDAQVLAELQNLNDAFAMTGAYAA